jgi:hypothetical protein
LWGKADLFGALWGGKALNQTSRLFIFIAVFALLMGLTSAGTPAQNAAGRIIGNVTDPSGDSISEGR